MVMPCSRSASSPSTSSAKSMSLAGGAVLDAVAFQRRELVVEDQLGVVEQPADQRRLAVIDAAAGEEAQQADLLLARQEMLQRRRSAGSRGCCSCQKYPSRFFFSMLSFSSRSISRPPRSEVRAVQHLGDDLRQASPPSIRCAAGQRIAAERAEAHQARLRRLAGLEAHALVIAPRSGCRRASPPAAGRRNTAARSAGPPA